MKLHKQYSITEMVMKIGLPSVKKSNALQRHNIWLFYSWPQTIKIRRNNKNVKGFVSCISQNL